MANLLNCSETKDNLVESEGLWTWVTNQLRLPDPRLFLAYKSYWQQHWDAHPSLIAMTLQVYRVPSAEWRRHSFFGADGTVKMNEIIKVAAARLIIYVIDLEIGALRCG
jgi:hypothetical protein